MLDSTSLLKQIRENTERTNKKYNDQSNNIDEIFTCFICLSKVLSPVMCPFCSKLCCSPCVKKWLTEQRSQCPHCRNPLRVSQLVNCRFVTEITAAIDELQSSKRKEKTEMCDKHETPLNYFCNTCQTSVCSDCAMFGTEHKQHEFERMTDVYDKHVELVQNEADGLKKRLNELNQSLGDIEVTIEKVTKAKEEKSNEVKAIVDQIEDKLTAQLKSKMLNLYSQKGSMTEEIEFLENMNQELNHQLNSVAKSALITKSYDLVKMLKEINERPASKFDVSSVPIDFQSEIIPGYESGIFHIKDYSRLRQTREIVYSEPLTTNGLVWRLKVYPNGNGPAKGCYVSVFLEMTQGLIETSKYEYRVEMVNYRSSNLCIVREFASDFEVGECWGYNRFFRIDLLNKDGYISSDSDTLTLKYYVRAQTYAQQSRDQKRYIENLESQLKGLQAQVSRTSKLEAIEAKKNNTMSSKSISVSSKVEQNVEEKQSSPKLENKEEEKKEDAVVIEATESINDTIKIINSQIHDEEEGSGDIFQDVNRGSYIKSLDTSKNIMDHKVNDAQNIAAEEESALVTAKLVFSSSKKAPNSVNMLELVDRNDFLYKNYIENKQIEEEVEEEKHSDVYREIYGQEASKYAPHYNTSMYNTENKNSPAYSNHIDDYNQDEDEEDDGILQSDEEEEEAHDSNSSMSMSNPEQNYNNDEEDINGGESFDYNLVDVSKDEDEEEAEENLNYNENNYEEEKEEDEVVDENKEEMISSFDLEQNNSKKKSPDDGAEDEKYKNILYYEYNKIKELQKEFQGALDAATSDSNKENKKTGVKNYKQEISNMKKDYEEKTEMLKEVLTKRNLIIAKEDPRTYKSKIGTIVLKKDIKYLDKTKVKPSSLTSQKTETASDASPILE